MVIVIRKQQQCKKDERAGDTTSLYTQSVVDCDCVSFYYGFSLCPALCLIFVLEASEICRRANLQYANEMVNGNYAVTFMIAFAVWSNSNGPGGRVGSRQIQCRCDATHYLVKPNSD